MSDSPYIIVGGGIAGLAASLGLARIGRSSLVLEKSPDFSALGAGLQLGPNAVAALQWLGVWDALEPHCVAPREIHIRDGVTGAILQRVALGADFESRFGAPYRVAHRNDLHAALLQVVHQYPGITLAHNVEVAGVSVADTTLAINSGKSLKAKAIIAADGVNSIVRNTMHGRDRAASGHTIYRALVPVESVPQGVDLDVVTLWLYPGGHVVHYAVSSGELFNIVASVVEGKTTPAIAFQRACGPLADILNAQRTWTVWPARDLKPKPLWSKNHTLLIGDAAHASLPYLAQGAAMALEDACVLAIAIRNTREIETAFGNFAKARFARASGIQKQSRRIGNIYHARGLLRQARNLFLQRMSQRRFMDRLSWIYGWKIPKE
jgi:2-polyprenyl-6-methoxyphenol hydroxylase-like FAD-dependent oxidoreductase